MKILDAKAAVDEEWEKLQTFPWDLGKVKSKKEVILEAQKDKTKSTLLHVCTFAPSKNAELEPKLQKCRGRVVLLGDIVKDDSRAYEVSTGQGSSASQVTAAKIMDVIARLPGCEGQAADAVSSCTLVKLEDAPKLLKTPKSECPDVWIRLPRQMAKIMGEN